MNSRLESETGPTPSEQFFAELTNNAATILDDEITRTIVEHSWKLATDGSKTVFPQVDRTDPSIFASESPTLLERCRVFAQIEKTDRLPGNTFTTDLAQSLEVIANLGERRRLALLLNCVDNPAVNQLGQFIYTQQDEHRYPYAVDDDSEEFAALANKFRADPNKVIKELLTEQFAAMRELINQLCKLKPTTNETPRESLEPVTVQIRDIERKDVDEIVEISRVCLAGYIGPDNLKEMIKNQAYLTRLAHNHNKIFGYSLGYRSGSTLLMSHLNVHPGWRQRSIGSQLFADVISDTGTGSLDNVLVDVPDSNTAATEFVLKHGFDPIGMGVGSSQKNPNPTVRYLHEPSLTTVTLQLLQKAFGSQALQTTQALHKSHQADKTTNPHLSAVTSMLQNLEADSTLHLPARQAFLGWLHTPDHHLLKPLIDESWKHLGKIKEPVVDEWLAHFKSMCGAEIDLPRQDEQVLRTAFEAMNGENHRQELLTLRKANNQKAVNAKEKAIIHEALTKVLEYPYAAYNYQEKPPTYIAATPHHVVDERATNCFSGPWLLASLLIRFGISPKNIFYAGAAYSEQSNFFSSHGSLIVRTSGRENVLADVGVGTSKDSFSPLLGKDKAMISACNSLLTGKTQQPVRFETNFKKIIPLMPMPTLMQILPAAVGFRSQHLLHSGLSLNSLGQPVAAQRAFELGASLNPIDPNLAYQQGLQHFIAGNIELAKTYLFESLALDREFMYAHFTLGEVALAEGDAQTARQHFTVYTKTKSMAYGDEGKLKNKAEEYLAGDDEHMLVMWQEQNQEHKID